MRPILRARQAVGQEDAGDFVADFSSGFAEDQGSIGSGKRLGFGRNNTLFIL
jgi:hypothetical protein